MYHLQKITSTVHLYYQWNAFGISQYRERPLCVGDKKSCLGHSRGLKIKEIKPLTPVPLTVHFSAALKALVLGNLFKVFRLDITFAREVCHLGIKMKKIWQSSYSFHYPQRQNARANVMANLSNLNKLPNTRVFVAAENGSVEVLELVALFLLKTGTFSAKNW